MFLIIWEFKLNDSDTFFDTSTVVLTSWSVVSTKISTRNADDVKKSSVWSCIVSILDDICFIFWFKSALFISMFMCSFAKSFINIYSWFSSSMFIWMFLSWKSFEFESNSAVSWLHQMSCIELHNDDSDDDDNFHQRIFRDQSCKRTWQWWRWHSSSLMLFIFISYEEHTRCIICKSLISVFI